jgi:DinB superfamily
MTDWGPRADVLLKTMLVIEMYTLRRALTGLTQEEFDWEPHPGAWGIRRREECTTPNATGTEGSEWVSDGDWAIAAAADRGDAIEPMTTIGWLLNHFGAAPGLVAKLEIVGGSTVPTPEIYERMWGRMIIPTVDDAVTRFKEGWSALDRALRSSSDVTLERNYEGHPWKRGDLAVTAMLNEVSHHGTQICMLRDLFAHQ